MGDLPTPKITKSKCCKNCHFLSKIKNPKHGGPTEPESLSEDERKYDWQTKNADGMDMLLMWREVWTPRCYKGIWKMNHLSGPNVISDDLYDDEVCDDPMNIATRLSEERGERCFFIEYTKGMEFDTASELHRIRYDHHQLQRNYMYTFRGLLIAVSALVANVIIEVYKLLTSP